jgi:flagellar biosynthesis protein FlhF
VISLDTVRAAGVDQLGAFTQLLGLQLRTASAPAELKTQFEESLAGYPVLIDTAGLNPFDPDEVQQLQAFGESVAAEVILVLAAGLDAFEAQEIADACRPLSPSRLITTRIDAARRLGGMLAAAAAADIGFSEVGHAPRIADGISAINPVSMARLIIRDPLAPSTRLAD